VLFVIVSVKLWMQTNIKPVMVFSTAQVWAVHVFDESERTITIP